jgi:hypothetical protein
MNSKKKKERMRKKSNFMQSQHSGSFECFRMVAALTNGKAGTKVLSIDIGGDIK